MPDVDCWGQPVVDFFEYEYQCKHGSSYYHWFTEDSVETRIETVADCHYCEFLLIGKQK